MVLMENVNSEPGRAVISSFSCGSFVDSSVFRSNWIDLSISVLTSVNIQLTACEVTSSSLLSCVHHNNQDHNDGQEDWRNWPGRERKTPTLSQHTSWSMIKKAIPTTAVLPGLHVVSAADQAGASISQEVHPNIGPNLKLPVSPSLQVSLSPVAMLVAWVFESWRERSKESRNQMCNAKICKDEL